MNVFTIFLIYSCIANTKSASSLILLILFLISFTYTIGDIYQKIPYSVFLFAFPNTMQYIFHDIKLNHCDIKQLDEIKSPI